jgi:starch synthase (maltosyl-transferring)
MPLESIAEAVAVSKSAAAAPAPRAPMAIYYVHPLLAGPLGGWGPLLDRAAAMGFDHVMSAPVFAAGPDGDLFGHADARRLDPRLGVGDALPAIRALAAACADRGLALLLDAPLDRVAGPVPSAAPATLDPREMAEAPPRELASIEAVSACIERLASLAKAGVRGFRLLGIDRVGPMAVARIAEGVRAKADVALLGFTPGLSARGREELQAAALDGVFSSLPWWDFSSDWLWDETLELAADGPVLAMPEAPFAPRLATRCHDPAVLEACYGRALGFASMSAGGWMMTMGCERAVSRQMSMSDDPADYALQLEGAPFDLSKRIAAMNARRGALAGLHGPRLLSAAGAPLLAAGFFDAPDPRQASAVAVALTNASPTRRGSLPVGALLAAAGGRVASLAGDGATFSAGDEVTVEPGASMLLTGRAQTLPTSAPAIGPAAIAAGRAPRIAIEAITPSVDGGRFPAKRVVGDVVVVEADIVVDGHDQLGVELLWRREDEPEWTRASMRPLGNDRFRASFPVGAMVTHLFTVEAWRDAFATFRDELAKKHAAGVNTTLELQEGALLAKAAPELAARLATLDEAGRRALLLAPETAQRMAEVDPRPFAVRHEPALPVGVDRPGAAFAAWYEIFPRSMSDDPNRHGTFADVERHLPRIAGMGFDVLYFPPIHPIGRTNRKGRNNTLTPAPDDPGSPYAIGSEEGGHTALHPQLGTLDDFRHLREAAEAHGLELAIDFAIQCAPDHPWLKEHKDWFAWRPDGTIRYAENPPKKYEDIVNVDFYAPGANPGLWQALCEAVLFWADQGVKLFRVDNPHTKPFPFWEWLIAQVRARHPDAVFLAEAFTRPKVMTRLAKIGFGQSYTYFTWRNTKAELTEYLTELSGPVAREVFRPHLFVNTPDINPVFTHDSGRPGFLIRSALAATLSGLWGLYCGFELCEAARMPGKEEYLDSEKYQLRAWDWDRPGNIVAEVTQLNRIRRANPALRTHLDVRFETVFNERIIYYAKSTPDRSNCLLIAVSLDPFNAQEADFELPLWEWGLPDDGALAIDDLVGGGSFVWRGKTQRMRLDPSRPYAVWRARPAV